MAATNSCARCQYRNAKVGDRWTPLDGFGFIHDRIILPQTKNGEDELFTSIASRNQLSNLWRLTKTQNLPI